MTTISDSLTIIPKGFLDVRPNDPPPPEEKKPAAEKAAKQAPEATEAAPEAEDTKIDEKAPVEPKKAVSEPSDDKDGDEQIEERSERGYKSALTREKDRRRTVEKANEALQEQLRQTLALAEKFMPKAKADQPEPKLEQFGSHDEYAEAKAEWLADRRLEAKEAEGERQRQAKEMKRLQDAHQDRLEAASTKYPDIEDIAKDPTLPVNDAMGAFIIKSKNGPELLWWLNENRAEAKRLYKMDPVEAIAELGEIRARLAAPVEKKSSKAPEPIDPVGANNSVKRDVTSPDTDSPTYWRDYEKREKERLALRMGAVVIRR